MSTTLPPAKSAHSNGAQNGRKPPFWSELAPAALAHTGRCDQPGDMWTAWQRHLAARPIAPALESLYRAAPLAWGLATSGVPDEALALSQRLNKKLTRASDSQIDSLALGWLSAVSDGPATPALALDALVWAYALPKLADGLSPSVWWRVVDELTRIASDATALDNSAGPLVQQWLAAELSLTLAASFPEIAACSVLASGGTAALSSGMEQLVSEKGLPRADQLHLLLPLLACWTRSLMLVRDPDTTRCKELRERLSAALRATLALSRRDGSLMLGQFTADRHLHQLVETALQVGGDAPTRDAARLLLEPQKPKKKKKAAPLPLPGLQCDTARIGLLRTDWSAAATSMAVRYNTADVELEMHRCGAMLLRGAWSLEIAVDGQRVQLQRPWENVCWVSDEDVDYLELEGRFGCGLRVQRQMLLARQENFLYLADAIVASSASELVYRSALPLVDGVSCQPAEETREIQLRASQPIGMALPLALPEWRRDPRGGALSAESGGLELKQSRSGRSLYAPLWIDLDRKRSRKPLTWRQLTIAQDRRIVSGEVAVGYRVQFGRKQWLIYRSLAERANRTLLGSNLVSEFMLARFKPEGEAEPLLEIE